MLFVSIILSIVTLVNVKKDCLNQNQSKSQSENYISATLTPDGLKFPFSSQSQSYTLDSKKCNQMIQFRHTPNEKIDGSGPVVGHYLQNCNNVCTCNGGKSCDGKNDPSSVAGATYDNGSC